MALCAIAFVVGTASMIGPNWVRDHLMSYEQAIATMRQQAPIDGPVLHAWPNGICPTGYLLQPELFERRGRHWDGCYKPGTWTPHLNRENGLMELHSSIDFLLHRETMRPPVYVTPAPNYQKKTRTHHE